MPERVIRGPFMPINLKKGPPDLARTFPPEIRTAQAAIKFVNSLDPKTGVHPLGWTGMRLFNWPSAGRVPLQS